MASTFGPRVPWVRGLPPGIHDWTADKDTWELYHLGEDWSQASDLAAEMPGKFAELKELFLIEATKAGAFPSAEGSGFRCAPRAAARASLYGVDLLRRNRPRARVLRPRPGHQAQRGRHRRGHPRARQRRAVQAGRVPGGVTCFAEDGILCYEYNLFEIQRTRIRAQAPLPAGKVKIGSRRTIRISCRAARST